jgi:hypothetical protein
MTRENIPLPARFHGRGREMSQFVLLYMPNLHRPIHAVFS